MGCDIHEWIEVNRNGQWVEIDSAVRFHRDYGLFGFLADVRNYSAVPPLSQPRGLPEGSSVPAEDAEFYAHDGHSASWFTLAELVQFDYGQMFEDRRLHGNTVGAGEGQVTTFREFLPGWWFSALDQWSTLAAPEAVRLVFYFDN